MPLVESTWLVGSQQIEELEFVVSGSGRTVPAGRWYLTHATAGSSLLSRIASQMSAAGLSSVSVVLLQNRRVRLSASATFTVTWTDVELRELLGFSGNLSGASSYTATRISPLLWSPGRVGTFTTPEAVASYSAEDENTQVSRDGVLVVTTINNIQQWNEIAWDSIPLDRVRTTDATVLAARGGTWNRFRQLILVPNEPFQIYQIVPEDSGSTTDVTLPTALNTYKRRQKLPPDFQQRRLENADAFWNMALEVIVNAG